MALALLVLFPPYAVGELTTNSTGYTCRQATFPGVVVTGAVAQCTLLGDARKDGELLVCPNGGGATLADTGGFVVGDEAVTMSATVRMRRPPNRNENQGLMLLSKGDEWMFGRGKNGQVPRHREL